MSAVRVKAIGRRPTRSPPVGTDPEWEEAILQGGGYQTVRFGPPVTPPVIKYLMIANAAVLILQSYLDSRPFRSAPPS